MSMYVGTYKCIHFEKGMFDVPKISISASISVLFTQET